MSIERRLNRHSGETIEKEGDTIMQDCLLMHYRARAQGGPVDWVALRKLHRALLRVAPSLGAAVAPAVVEGEVDGPEAGLRALDAVADPALAGFQPAWTACAYLLATAGPARDAAEAYRRAIDLTTDAGVVKYLRRRLAAVAGEC